MTCGRFCLLGPDIDTNRDSKFGEGSQITFLHRNKKRLWVLTTQKYNSASRNFVI